MNSSGNALLLLEPTTRQQTARASSATRGSTSADGATKTPPEAPWVGPVIKKNKTPKATTGTHVTPPKGGATAVFLPTQLTPHASNPPDMDMNTEPPDGGASTSSEINSPILLSDSPQNLGPSLEATVIADFTTTQLAATPTTTQVQNKFMTHAATLDNAIASPTPPSTDLFNAMILRALGDISGKFKAINQRLNGMPTTATMTSTIREESTPHFVTLETRITTTKERLDSMATTTAAMLCKEFDQKFSDLNKRVGKTDKLLMAKIDD
jgi:hypothetical protein